MISLSVEVKNIDVGTLLAFLFFRWRPTVCLTSVDNLVPGNQEFCFAHLQTIVGQVKK